MKKICIAIFSILLLSSICKGQPSDKASTLNTINVSITGFESNDGKVFIGLYNSESTWLSKRYKDQIAEINNLTSSAIFSDLPAGEYAISIYHDENDNGIMDTKWFGIPTEAYACSRGAKGFMGPPKWKNAVMKIESSTDVIIKF